MVQSYRDLIVWQKAMELAVEVFAITNAFPKEQRYVLTSQIQRSAFSIPSNIAEGRSRHSRNDFIYHLNIARGSLAELETQLLIAQRLNYLDPASLTSLLDQSEEITRMLFGLRDSLTPSAKTSNLKPETIPAQIP